MSTDLGRIEATPPRGRYAGVSAPPLVMLIARRLVGLVFVSAVVMVAVFLMVQLVPGDPIYQAFGADITREQYLELRKEYHFDKPLPEQFKIYVENALHGDFGRSRTSQQPVSDLIRQRIRTSAELAVAALLIVLLVGIPLGILAAALTKEGRHPAVEVGFMGVTGSVASVPDYLMGTILAFVFAVWLRVLPVAGTGGVKPLILPALAVSLASTMSLARIVRLETLNVLAQDYIRTARSQRLPAYIIYGRHVLPNVLTAALTIAGLIFAGIIGGAVIVESVFARPGLGSALVEAVINNNYPVVQGITLLFCILVVLVNLLIDIALALIDPRSLAKES